jgi:hypothetical protein
MWCGFHTDLDLKRFVNPEGLNYGDLVLGVVAELMS